MKILIISDTHGKNLDTVKDLVLKIRPAFIVHCGDGCGTERYLDGIIPGCTAVTVKGNCDGSLFLEDYEILNFGKTRLFITHGHEFGVAYGTERLKEAAREHNCNVAVYGHTHIPVIDQSDDVTVINPGSLTYPRQPGAKRTFILLEIDKNGDSHFHLSEC